jgi:soluble lytic murein transglycosylase-like protein
MVGNLDMYRGTKAISHPTASCWMGLLIAMLLVFFSYGESQAGMYMCRDKSGNTSFTNLQGGANCSSYSLDKKNGRWSTNSRVASSGSSSSKYDQYIKRVGKRYDIDPYLIKAIIHAESAFNHRAVSPRGAQGLMQLMPATARELRVANPFNPKDNIDGGTRYFRGLMDSFNGDLVLSLAAYNAGPGLVKRTGGVPQIPETLRYINKVLRQYKVYKTSQNLALKGDRTQPHHKIPS